jgi:hypothetical protein
VAVALVALFALVSLDCLNLIQSDAWTDLSQAPHMAAAFSHGATSGARTVKTVDAGAPARGPEATGLVVLVLVWMFVEGVEIVHGRAARRRERGRAPPAPPLRPGVA